MGGVVTNGWGERRWVVVGRFLEGAVGGMTTCIRLFLSTMLIFIVIILVVGLVKRYFFSV